MREGLACVCVCVREGVRVGSLLLLPVALELGLRHVLRGLPGLLLIPVLRRGCCPCLCARVREVCLRLLSCENNMCEDKITVRQAGKTGPSGAT